tara:strand:- start:1016 stop:1483 length:468 start_codon:yes stop_codon:yes gene_type:complete
VFRKIALFASLSIILAGPAVSQNKLLSKDDIIETLSGNWVIDPAEDPETDTNCEDNFLNVRFRVEDNIVIYIGQWAGSDVAYQSEVSQITSDAGQVLPTILLQYDDEVRTDDNGDLVSWALFMPDEDHFYWTRRDWPFGRRTAMRVRCPGTALIG